MDNPQHYQPLSHALHPPRPPTSQSKPTYAVYNSNPTVAPALNTNHREEEEEEEEDDEDEGIVEQQLNDNLNDHDPGVNVPPDGPPSACVHRRENDLLLVLTCLLTDRQLCRRQCPCTGLRTGLPNTYHAGSAIRS